MTARALLILAVLASALTLAGAGGGAAARTTRACSRPAGVQDLTFSKVKYPHIRRHVRRALARGWPRILVVNRRGDDARRQRRLRDVPTRRNFDRDEYPPAVGRGRPNGTLTGLVRGTDPRGWKADVAYVPSAENRSHGSSLGGQLRKFCDGTRFRYVFG